MLKQTQHWPVFLQGAGGGGSGGGAKCPILCGIKKLPHTQYTITMQQQAQNGFDLYTFAQLDNQYIHL